MIRLDQKISGVGVLFSYLKPANSSKVEISMKDGQLHFHLRKRKKKSYLASHLEKDLKLNLPC